MKRYLRRAIRRIKIIWHWLPIIWNDYDFDHYYILEALRHKIERTRIAIARNNNHTTAESDCKNMRIAELLIKRIQEGDYSEYRQADLCTCTDPLPDSWTEDVEVSPGFTRARWKNPFCDWCQLKSSIKRSSYREKYDWEYLFAHLNKNMKLWWD